MTEDNDNWERNQKAKAEKAWNKTYSKLKPISRTEHGGGEETLTFLDWVRETESKVKTKTTNLTMNKKSREMLYIHSFISESQRFLVISGPLAGQKKTLEEVGDDYQWFNNAGSPRFRDKNIPHAIFVHKSSFKFGK